MDCEGPNPGHQISDEVPLSRLQPGSGGMGLDHVAVNVRARGARSSVPAGQMARGFIVLTCLPTGPQLEPSWWPVAARQRLGCVPLEINAGHCRRTCGPVLPRICVTTELREARNISLTTARLFRKLIENDLVGTSSSSPSPRGRSVSGGLA
jgi:hypothetical protein